MKKRKKAQQDDTPKLSAAEKLAGLFELPEELVSDVPKFSLTSNRRLLLQNYIGMLEYGQETIRINTKIGIVKIEGRKLEVESITSEEVWISGQITAVNFTA